MPKALERKLKKEAKSKGLKGERADAYVYGTMRKTGWTPSTQKKSRSPKKHEAKKHNWDNQSTNYRGPGADL